MWVCLCLYVDLEEKVEISFEISTDVTLVFDNVTGVFIY
jgi:hypothetical protein